MGDIFTPRSVEDLSLSFPPELEHISASSLKMAVRCEEQWRQRYILGRKLPPALSMIAGRADHKAIETSMRQKIDTHVDLPVHEVRELFVAELESEVEREGGINELEVRNADSEMAKVRALDEERRQGPEVVAAYQTQAAPRLQPLAVEKEFRLQVADVPVDVLGYIDLVAVEAGLFGESVSPPDMRIIDRKRRTRRTLKIEPEWSIQAEIYQLAVPAPHEWHLSVTTKTPQIVAFEPELVQGLPPVERSQRLLQQLVYKIGWLYQRFGPDEPWPTTGKLHPWACSYCGFRKECWGWQT